jgi:hypothetical protein
MTPPAGRSPAPAGRSSATWAAVTVLLAVGIAGTLIVPIYARTAPQWGPFPFFYWYQLIWVPVVAILAWIAYLLLRVRRAPGGTGQGGTPE